MADLRKFDDFITQLREEVASLDKQQSTIAGELVTLSARKTHLESSIDSLTAQAEAERSKRQAAITELEARIRQLEADRIAVEKSIAWLEEKNRLATEALQLMQQSADEDVVKFNSQIEAKKAALTGLEAEKEVIQTDCDALGQEIAGRTESLAALDRQVAEKQAETDETIRQMTASAETAKHQLANAKLELDNKLDELEEAEKRTAAAQKLIADAHQQHHELLEYEERAKKALEARESALLDREQELARDIMTAKRRNGVLDKL